MDIIQSYNCVKIKRGWCHKLWLFCSAVYLLRATVSLSIIMIWQCTLTTAIFNLNSC